MISWSAKSKIFSLVKIRKFVNVREESGETKQTKAKELSEREEKGESVGSSRYSKIPRTKLKIGATEST